MDGSHKYQIRAASRAVRSGVVKIEGIEPIIAFSAPPEFKGLPDHWTPEHFLVAAVASCYVSTFSGMAFNSNFDFTSLELDTVGTLSQDPGGWRFSEIKIYPRLAIPSEERRATAHRLLNKAKENCLIARSLSCPLVLESAVVIGEQIAA